MSSVVCLRAATAGPERGGYLAKVKDTDLIHSSLFG